MKHMHQSPTGLANRSMYSATNVHHHPWFSHGLPGPPMHIVLLGPGHLRLIRDTHGCIASVVGECLDSDGGLMLVWRGHRLPPDSLVDASGRCIFYHDEMAAWFVVTLDCVSDRKAAPFATKRCHFFSAASRPRIRFVAGALSEEVASLFLNFVGASVCVYCIRIGLQSYFQSMNVALGLRGESAPTTNDIKMVGSRSNMALAAGPSSVEIRCAIIA
ncbi:hypothetical protein C8Q79DRAFT_88834 [Trametes meyenii]|nr:hypothetical protein C8Q79DRAFT_88834 [Trametes meyenii]